jgi:hypothetical protein
MDIFYSFMLTILSLGIYVLYGKVNVLSDEIEKIKLKCDIKYDDDEENT